VYWSICIVAAWIFNRNTNLLLLGVVSQGALAAALTAICRQDAGSTLIASR